MFEKRSTLLALLLILASEAPAEPFRPNVILITVDTFRPDHIGYYGYHRDTSPNLDAFCREGVFFRQAFSSSGWTTPGLISILTSLYAPTHAVDIRGRRLDPEAITLPEVLRQAGYQAPDIFFLTEIPNFANLGMEPYARRNQLIDQGDDILFRWLEEDADPEKPFFLYYHYRDLHLPYDPGPRYEALFLPEAFEAPLGLLSHLKRFIATEKMGLVKKSVMLTRGAMDFAGRDRPWVEALYDGEIRRMDEEFFGRLRRTLKETGFDRNTLLVISADHGEELLDRDLIGHISTFKERRLYDEIIRIPLVFWFPGVLPEGKVLEEPVQCVDLMPTVLELIGLPLPQGAQGQSLLRLIQGRPGWQERPIFLESSAGGFTADEAQYRQRIRAVRTSRWKLIYLSPEKTYQLYDLERDPGERDNALAEQASVADSLRGLLNEWVLYTQRRAYRPVVPQPDTSRAVVALSAGSPQILFPRDGDTLQYQGAEHTISLRWTGQAEAGYAIEYEVGQGAYHLEGIITEASASPEYGPFQPGFWNSLVLYNPWKFRVWREDRPREKSDWVEFYLASSEEGEGEWSWAGGLLHLRQGLQHGLVEARNLFWGLGRGLLDLYLLLASVKAADLSAYALIAVLWGAICWPTIERLGQARYRAWGAALAYVALVYSTIPLMPQVWGLLREYTQGAIRHAGILAVGGVGACLVVQAWRRARLRRWSCWAALVLILPAYAYLLHQYALFPAERLHLVEYGFMGYFLFRALRLDLRPGLAYLASFALTVLIGLGDECIQWILPERFFELKDVQLNAVSGGLGLLLVRFVVRPGEKDEH